MRRIVAGLFQSIDGIVQSPGAPEEDRDGGFEHGGWVMPHFDETVAGFVGDVFAAPFDLLLGRRTYDIFAAHWPHVTGDDMADRINAAAKYVLTHRPVTSGWQGTHPLDGFDAVQAVKAGTGPDLLIQGSTSLHAGLLDRGLLDRLYTITFPILLGSGKRAFDGAPARGLTLVDHRVSRSGVVIAVYEKPETLRIEAVPTP